MERKPKLLATESCNGEGGCSGRTADLFSNLPDQIAHHILSFLAITDLARFGCVSKRCRKLYLSTPKLVFDEFSEANTSECNQRLKLLSYLDRLISHRGDNRIQCFRVHWYKHNADNGDETPCSCVHENFRMLTWIQNAVRCNVEKLDLDMTLYDYEEELFPSCVFLCGSLRSLVVNMYCTIVKTPRRCFSSYLKYLELGYVHVGDEDFFKWVSCSCKCIEELHLENISGTETITIESSSLKKLHLSDYCNEICHINISGEKVEDLTIAWVFDSPNENSLYIRAPNLRDLKWVGNLMNRLKLGKLERLFVAGVLLQPEVDDSDNAFEVLCSLCRAKCLVLNEGAITAAFKKGSGQAFLCDGLSLYLSIGSFSDEVVQAMVSLLRGMPNLCDLVIQSNPSLDDPESNTFGFNVKYWKMQNLAFIDQLETVTIELCSGSNGIELDKYVLKCAPDLQEMVILFLAQDMAKVMSLTTTFMGCNKISSAEVVIREKQPREEKHRF